MNFSPRKTCQIKDCQNLSVYTPVMKFLPPRSYRYSGPPIEARTTLAICEEHRLYFIEHTAMDLLMQGENMIREQGRPIDSEKSTIELVRIADL